MFATPTPPNLAPPVNSLHHLGMETIVFVTTGQDFTKTITTSTGSSRKIDPVSLKGYAPVPMPRQNKRCEPEKPKMEALLSKILCGMRCISNDVEALNAKLALFMSKAGLATKNDLKKLGIQIMSAISDYAVKQKTFNDRQGAAIDKLVTSTDGLVTDVAALNAQIKKLQESVGPISPEDQASLDELQAQGESLSAKVEAASAALAALDEQTPPVIPPVA